MGQYTFRLGKQCELFTLLKKGTEEAILQMQLFDDGRIHSEVFAPLLMQINPKKKFVLVGIFDTSNWDNVPSRPLKKRTARNDSHKSRK